MGHRDYGKDLLLNLPEEAQVLLNQLFDQNVDIQWSHSGMAYGFAERLSITDVEEFVYCLNEEIKLRRGQCQEF